MISPRQRCAVDVLSAGVWYGCVVARVQWLAQRTTSGWRRRCDCHWDLAVLCRPCSEALAPRAMAKRSMVRVYVWSRVNATEPHQNYRCQRQLQRAPPTSAGPRSSALALTLHAVPPGFPISKYYITGEIHTFDVFDFACMYNDTAHARCQQFEVDHSITNLLCNQSIFQLCRVARSESQGNHHEHR